MPWCLWEAYHHQLPKSCSSVLRKWWIQSVRNIWFRLQSLCTTYIMHLDIIDISSVVCMTHKWSITCLWVKHHLELEVLIKNKQSSIFFTQTHECNSCSNEFRILLCWWQLGRYHPPKSRATMRARESLGVKYRGRTALLVGAVECTFFSVFFLEGWGSMSAWLTHWGFVQLRIN